MLTSSLEEYLKTIYILYKNKEIIRVTDIATNMGISKPSVNRAINILKEQGYIEYSKYENIKLTEKGFHASIHIIEKYDTIKLFLTEVLKINEEVATKEAVNINKGISIETLNKLRDYTDKILNIQDLRCINCDKCNKCIKNKKEVTHE